MAGICGRDHLLKSMTHSDTAITAAGPFKEVRVVGKWKMRVCAVIAIVGGIITAIAACYAYTLGTSLAGSLDMPYVRWPLTFTLAAGIIASLFYLYETPAERSRWITVRQRDPRHLY